MFPCHEAQTARKMIDELAEDEVGIYYVTEAIASQIPETIRRYDAEISPAIILIPNHKRVFRNWKIKNSKKMLKKRLDKTSYNQPIHETKGGTSVKIGRIVKSFRSSCDC